MKVRDLKFRGWDQDARVMIDFSNPQISFGDGKIKLVFGENFHDDFFEGSIVDIPLMQFTGLKDKNGREIYEGDIVRRGYFALNDTGKFGDQPWLHLPEGVKDNDITTILETWIVDSEVHSLPRLSEAIHSNPDVIGVEIIGNIYEHPDLVPES